VSEQEKPYTIIVGVSATTKSPAALVWAKALADANGGRLVAVRVYQASRPADTNQSSSPGTAPHDPALVDEQAAQLQRDVAEVLGEDHGAEIRVVHASKRQGLINVSRGADLLVIDAPRGPSMSPLLAHRVVYAATCPVVVMPPAVSGAGESALARSARAVGRAALRSAGTSGRPGFRPPAAPAD